MRAGRRAERACTSSSTTSASRRWSRSAGLIETPNIKRIADSGLTYTNFHTTALCSPTRSCLLTGRNHTTNGDGVHHRGGVGFPNASGHIPRECAMIPEVLGERGWNTYMVGKWHLCAEDEMNLASTKTGLAARGAASSASTASSAPRRTSGTPTSSTTTIRSTSRSRRRRATTSRSTSPTRRCRSSGTPRRSRRTSRSSSTTRLGAGHAPHHVPKEWADKYKGKFDMGYEAYRETRLRQPEEARDHPRATPSSRRSTPTPT